jgi:CHAT domain-containing protein
LALHHYQEALTVYTCESFPEQWAMAHNNLARAYMDRIRGERAENLELAIDHYQEALTVYTCKSFPEQWAMAQNNLASACRDRVRGERAENLELAIHLYQEALTVYTRESFPGAYRTTLRSLGHLHFEQGDWAPAHVAYAAAIDAGADLLAEAYTETGRLAEVGETGRLYADDAYALLLLGRPDDSLLRLEQGKTRLLDEALALGDFDLQLLPPVDQKAMRSIRHAIRNLEEEMRLPANMPAHRSDRELAEALHQLRADLNRRIEGIRAEYPHFMPTGVDLPNLLDVVPEGGALVAPLFTSKGSAVFVLPHAIGIVTEEHVIQLEEFTDEDLHTLLQGSADKRYPAGRLGAYADYHISPTTGFFRKKWFEAIETVGRELWDSLLGPVHERLKSHGLKQDAPILIIPQGGLGLLPLHAAWRTVDGQKRYFLDDWTVSYVPSVYALLISRRRLQEPQRQAHGLLAIINPTKDIPFTSTEGEAVVALFSDVRCLFKNAATVSAVRKAAPGRQYLHFACHGFYNWQDAMQSCLLLAERQPLTVSEIIGELDLSASRLVTLSACETGLVDIRQSPDEYLGLPAGFLQAGAPAVVSSLWPLNDLSTMLLMERFYRAHLVEDLAPAAALREAQLWLRDATAEELQKRLREAILNPPGDYEWPTLKPFAHPYYWAGFIFSGE